MKGWLEGDALGADRLTPLMAEDPSDRSWERVWSTLLILLTFAVSQGYIHFQYCVLPYLDEHIVCHNYIIAKKWFSPFTYRLLAPYTAELLIRCFSVLFAYETAFKFAFMFWGMLAMSTTVVGSWLYFRLWFSEGLAASGALLVGSSILMILMSKESYMSHWSMIEPGFWALGFWCIAQNRNGLLATLIVLATINRETSCFIVLAYILSNTDILYGRSDDTVHSKRKWSIIYVSCWLLTYGLIRVWQGHAWNLMTIGDILRINVENQMWTYFFRQMGLALSFFWVLVLLGAKFAPKQVRMACRIIPFYLAAVLVFGIWYELRLLTPLCPLVVAIGLSYVEKRT